MKKSYLLGLVALTVAATSCSNEEPASVNNADNAIEFSTYVGRDALTRGSVFTTSEMQTQGFGVFAAYTAQDNYDAQTMNFMYNQQVTYSASAWTYSPLKYWPNNPGDKVSFFAYAPYNVEGAALNASLAKITYTVADAVADQKDLTVADALKDQTKQSITDKVTFNFKHVLSRIGLNVEAQVDLVNSDATGDPDNGTTGNGALASETNITVTKVELIGKFDKDGVIDLTNSTWSEVAPAASDVIYTWEAANFDSSVATNVTTTKQKLNNVDNYAMIIPQNLSGMTVKVYYTVTTTDASEPKNNSTVNNVITSAPFNFNFQQGEAYMFNLHLGMTSVKFDASVSDWDTATETVVNVPINNN